MTREHWHILLKVVLLWGTVILAALFLCGCKTQYVTVPEIHTVYSTDTLEVHDSIHVHTREYIKGDTVYKDSIVYRDRWRERKVEVATHDTVPVPVEVEKTVYKRSGYDRFTSWFFWIVAAAAVLALAWFLFRKFYLRK